MKLNPRPKRLFKSLRVAVGSILVLGAAAIFAASAVMEPDGALEPLTAAPEPDFTPQVEGSNLWFVELQSPPAVKGTSMAKLNAEKKAFRDVAASAGVTYTERYAFSKLWNGFSIQADRTELSTITRLPGVKAVYPVNIISPPKQDSGFNPDLQTAIAMTGADIVQNTLGFNGAGIKVAVMDTGIDYDHADLGGDGVARQNSTHFPTARVTTGWDFVGDDYNASSSSPNYQPVPHPDAYPDDCFGHGTHVAGIVGASGNFATGGARGVAPGVTYGAYRVFGCEGSTSDDVMIAAMERILDDGMNVMNMSIGDAFDTWPEAPTAQAATNLVDAGVVVVASIGNSGASGVWSAGAPGVGAKVIGVASYDNSHVRLTTINVTPANVTAGYTNATGAPAAPTSGSLPLDKANGVGTVPPGTLPTNDGCTAVAPGTYAGKAILIRRGTCGFYEKARRAQLAGASAVILYNNAAGRINPTVAVVAGTLDEQPVTIPVIAVSDTEGVAIHNAIVSGSQTLNWTNTQQAFPNATGGLISSFSSYGLGADLSIKPDIGAPGGLIRSTWPLEAGAYATISGTSMASPHVAGAVALLLQSKGWTTTTPAQAASVRGLLQNTAVPANWSGNPGLGFLDFVHRQGAGLLHIDKAIQAPVSITPAKLSQGEAGPALTHTLTLTNSSGSSITYNLSNQAALSTTGSTFAPSANTVSAGTVVFSSPSVTVPANGTATVNVTIPRPDYGVSNRVVYGGYIRFTPTTSGTTLRVPYAGFGGDYQGIGVLTGGGAAACGGTNEVQSVAITGGPTGGTFSLEFTPHGGTTAQTTAPIAYNATAAAVKSALEALPSVGAGNVTTSGGPLPGTAVTVTFTGALGCQDIPTMTAQNALTGGTSPAPAITATTNGAARFPKLARQVAFVTASDGSIVGSYDFPDSPVTYTMEKTRQLGRMFGDIPTLGIHFDHQARWVKMTVLDANGNPVVSQSPSQTLDPIALSIDFMSRNSSAGGFFAFSWDGRLVMTQKNGGTYSKNMPNGQYKLRIEILKALGTAPTDVETYTSPTFTIARP